MSNALKSDCVTDSLANQIKDSHPVELQQSLKQATQQAKFLHLQAEIESLWQKVQRSKNKGNN